MPGIEINDVTKVYPGGVKALGDELRDLDTFPTFEDAPEYYTDYAETGPYVAETGESECAT